MVPDSGQDDFQAKTAAFCTWIQQQPGTAVSPKIRIADLRAQGQGRGVIAVRDVEENEELFTLSYSSTLTTKNSALNTLKKTELGGLEKWAALALTIIYEDGQGQDSAWWPYLSILPTTFDTPIFWSPSEIEELQGSAVRNKIGKEKADQLFTKELLPIVQADSAIYGRHAPSFAGPNAVENVLQIGHRVATLIHAYGFDLDPDIASDKEQEVEDEGEDEDLDKGMVPLADLLNADGDLNNAHMVQDEDSVTMVALKPIKAGEQIFNDFGELPRSDLLRRYGYVTDNYKKWDVVELPLSLIVEVIEKDSQLSGKEKDQRLELADEWQALEEGYDLVWPEKGQEFEFPQELILTMNALQLEHSSYGDEEQARRPPMKNGIYSRQPRMYSALRDIIAQRQAQYDTTIAEDRKLLKDADLTKRHRLAIEVRLGEKELLAMALVAANRGVEAFVESEETYEHTRATANKRRKT